MLWDIFTSWLLWSASLLPVEAWWIIAAIVYVFVGQIPIIGPILPRIYFAIGVLFYGYAGEIYNKGWQDREIKYEKVLQKKIKKEKSGWVVKSPGDKLKEYVKPDKKRDIRRR